MNTIAARAAWSGIHDAAPGLHEPFRQSVVEDDFVGGERPDLAAAGVPTVADVTPGERMKLRMPNGRDSVPAHLGHRAGHETIADAVAAPAFAAYRRRVRMDEILPAVEPPPGADLGAYATQLFDRYVNPAIRRLTWQIAMDGGQKLPQRLLAMPETNLAEGRPSPGADPRPRRLDGLGGRALSGRPTEMRDPLAGILRAAAAGPDPVGALLCPSAVFPAALAARLAAPLRAARERLIALGNRAAVAGMA